MTSAPAIPAAAGGDEIEKTRERTDAFYRHHSRTVARICRGLLRDRAEAEDATQQVFLSAHRALLQGAAPRDPAAWLATIARNECVARIRKRMSTPLGVPVDAVDRVAPDPLAETTQRAEVAAFWQALGDLPAAQRDAVVLREIRGLSYDQLADQLALSHASVRSLLSRGRQGLRVRLRDVHSGLGGVSWIETLARLFTGGGASTAPVGAKAVALGLGAAAITGGAVVTPEALDRHHLRPVQAQDLTKRAAPEPAPVRVVRRVDGPTASDVPRSRVERRPGRRDDRERSGDRGDRRSGDGERADLSRGSSTAADEDSSGSNSEESGSSGPGDRGSGRGGSGESGGRDSGRSGED